MTTPGIQHQLWNLMIDADKAIGKGIHRTVYEFKHSKEYVCKVAPDAKCFANAIEWETWREVRDTEFARWFAPCLDVSPDSTILVQRRTTPAGPSQFPDRMPSFFCDFKRTNFGMLDGRFVCHDYGMLHRGNMGLTRRLKKVEWWNVETRYPKSP